MNVKKMFAATAGVLLAAVAVVPASALGAASYGAELQGAYEYAFSKGITTMTSIDSANMYGELTRGQLAKMIANWSEAELGTKADETKVCSFTDANKAEGDLASYVKKACQMGLMGQGIAAFRPNDKVTRGEFGTTLSRALWGDKYNTTETPYYKNHLVALKDAGIMKMIDTPNQMEVRGYVMLMLQRATANNPEAACKDPLIVLACTLGSDTCPANCKKSDTKEEPKMEGSDRPDAAGSLEVGVADKVATIKSIPANGTAIFGSLKVAAGSNEVKLYNVEVERFGLGERNDIKRVYFERDGVRISGRAGLTSDGKATITFAPALVVKANGSETIDLVVNLEGVAGSEHGFKIVAVDSTAKDLNVSERETSTFRTTTYNVAEADVSYKGSNTTYKAKDSDNLEFGAFRIDNRANGKDITVKSFILRNDGNGDLTNLKNIAIYRDSTKVSKGDAIVSGKEVVVAVDTVIEGGKGANLYIKADVASVDNENGDTYQLRFKNAEDLNIVETSTKFRTKITIPSGSMKTYTVEGGNVRLVRDSALSLTQNVAKGTDDVVMMKGKLNVKQAITLEDATINFAAATDLKGKNAKDYIRKITLVIGGNQLNGTFDNTAVKFDGAVTVSRDTDVELRVSFYSNFNQTPTIEFDKLEVSKFNVAEYVSNQNRVSNAIGSLPSVRATLVDSKINVSKSDGLNARTVVAGAKDENVLGMKISSQESQEITVSKIELTDTTTTIANDLVSADLYVNDKVERTATLRNGKLSFDGLNLKVKKGQDVNLMVKADFDASIPVGKTLTLKLKAVNNFGTDYNGRDVELRSDIVGSTITISNGGSVTISTASNTPNAKLLAAGIKDVELGRFTLDAKDDTLRLTDVYLKAVSALNIGDKVSNPRLYVGSGLVANGQFFAGNSVLGFEDITTNNIIAASKTQEFRVVADINDGTTVAAYAQNLLKLQLANTYTNGTAGTIDGLRVVSNSNGAVINTANPGTVVSKENMLVRTALTAANAAGTNEISQTTAGVFSLTANGHKAKPTQASFRLTTNLVGAAGNSPALPGKKVLEVVKGFTPEVVKGKVTLTLGGLSVAAGDAQGAKTIALTSVATDPIDVKNGDTQKVIAEKIKAAIEAKYTTDVEVVLNGDNEIVVTEKTPGYLTQAAVNMNIPAVALTANLSAGSDGTVTIAATDITYGGTNLTSAITLNATATAEEIAEKIKDVLPAKANVDVTREGAKLIFKHQTAGAGNNVAAIVLAGKGDLFVDETESVNGANQVLGSTKIGVVVYKDSIAGSNKVGEVLVDNNTSFDINLAAAPELEGGKTTKFYVVLEGTTIAPNTTVSTELQLTNVKYNDILNDGTKLIETMSSYDQGLPLKWNK